MVSGMARLNLRAEPWCWEGTGIRQMEGAGIMEPSETSGAERGRDRQTPVQGLLH